MKAEAHAPTEPERHAAFVTAYDAHHDAVYRAARRVCGPGHATDVTQDVFLRLWARPDDFDAARGSLRAFLLTVGHSRAIDLMRAQSARDARQRRTAPEEHAGPDIDRDLLRQERVTTVALAVDALPAHQREAIVTAFYGERTYKDAAAALGYAEGTVKSRIRAGLHRLRSDLVPVAG